MNKIILICGKLCSGKTTYARQLCAQSGAQLLSLDALMLALFAQEPLGAQYDVYAARAKDYLLAHAAHLCAAGLPLVLDWGFWRAEERAQVRTFFAEKGIACEFHYLDVSADTWQKRIQKRNLAVRSGAVDAYYVDEGLAQKFERLFEAPRREEMDIWVEE